MKVADTSWLMIERYLETNDLAVVPLGSTEQHAHLSLAVDNILAERIATEAAEPLAVPVFPVLNYGVTPYFIAYPGTVSLRLDTYFRIIDDILSSLERYGFRRIVLLNGHGGNSPAAGFVTEWVAQHPAMKVKWHNWWNAPKTLAKVREIDPHASHASWMENFPWTRLAAGDSTAPDTQKPMADAGKLAVMNPAEVRAYLAEGNMGGVFQKDDATMLELWQVGVSEARAAIESNW